MSGPASLDEAKEELAEMKRHLAALQQKVSAPLPLVGAPPTHSPVNTAHSHFSIDAGGLAVLAVTFFAAIVLTVNLVGVFWYVSDRADARATISEIQSQLRERREGENAIRAYINTGILKPKSEPEKK